MKKLLILLCTLTMIFAMVGTASALSFKTFNKKYEIGMKFNKKHDIDKFTFDLDDLKIIDSEDKVKGVKIKLDFVDKSKKWSVDILKDMTALKLEHIISVIVDRDKGNALLKSITLSGKYKDLKDQPPAATPEPATILLMGIGLLGLVAYSRKRFSKKS